MTKNKKWHYVGIAGLITMCMSMLFNNILFCMPIFFLGLTLTIVGAITRDYQSVFKRKRVQNLMKNKYEEFAAGGEQLTYEEIDEYASKHGWAHSHCTVTKEDIEHLLNGGVIVFMDGEYTHSVGLNNKLDTEEL